MGSWALQSPVLSKSSNLTAEIGHCAGPGLCRSHHEQNGKFWAVLGGGGFLGHHEAKMHQLSGVKLRKFQQAQRLPRSSQSASHGTLGSAEPSRLQLLGVTMKLVITLYPGPCHGGPLNRNHNERQVVYKATTSVLKGACTQPACRDDQSDTLEFRGAEDPLPTYGRPVLYSSARPCSCICATNFRFAFQQSIALYKGQ